MDDELMLFSDRDGVRRMLREWRLSNPRRRAIVAVLRQRIQRKRDARLPIVREVWTTETERAFFAALPF